MCIIYGIYPCLLIESFDGHALTCVKSWNIYIIPWLMNETTNQEQAYLGHQVHIVDHLMLMSISAGAYSTNNFSIKVWMECKFVLVYWITTNFCTWHDSLAVMPCAKFCSDHLIKIWMRMKWNFHEICILIGKSSLRWVTDSPGVHSTKTYMILIIITFGNTPNWRNLITNMM